MNQKYLIWGLVGMVLILILVLSLKGCKSNTAIGNIVDTASVPVKTYTQDSLKVRQQELLIVQSQGTIEALQDSLERITEKLTNVVPQFLIRYRDTIIFKEKVIQLYRDTTLLRPIWNFSDSSKWYNINGTIDSNVLRLNRLSIFNKTSVIIGQKGSWWQPQTIVVNVAQANPYLTTGSIQSYYFKPKEGKWTLVAGPSLLFNGKSFYKGVAITAGYRVF